MTLANPVISKIKSYSEMLGNQFSRRRDESSLAKMSAIIQRGEQEVMLETET